MISAYELTAALEGIRRLIRRDDSAFSFFDLSENGFWKSLASFALIIVLQIVVLLFMLSPGSLLYAILREATTGLVLWLAYPLIAHYLLIYLDCREHYFVYIVPFNWLQLPFNLLLVFMGLLVRWSFAPFLLFYVIIGGWLFYHWRLARTSLHVSGGMALAIVLFEFFLTLILQGLALAVTRGFNPPLPA